ncbi:hypothetical protein L21SP2_1182 [Salinispira pacifica]|uniref:Uncharacterized protein n=1 Tax=Salinispira pacifica TaxID=1307761 RepID=V5WG46_9SPIO|nr:hypothetical protein L21SP2_1182 [Salinispira pacifica]
MQNLSVADIFPSSIPEHPRVQSPMNRDHGGKQFSDYFTPPAEPAYRPLIREPGMVPGFTSGSGAGMYPASDQLYNSISSTHDLLKSPQQLSRHRKPGTHTPRSFISLNSESGNRAKNSGKMHAGLKQRPNPPRPGMPPQKKRQKTLQNMRPPPEKIAKSNQKTRKNRQRHRTSTPRNRRRFREASGTGMTRVSVVKMKMPLPARPGRNSWIPLMQPGTQKPAQR